MTLRTLILLASFTFSTACVSNSTAVPPDPGYTPGSNPHFAQIAAETTAADRDRAAILAMRGDYRVDFRFQETVPLQAGYEVHDDKNSGGFETVLVVEDSPGKIVLQHILVSPGGHVVKHWRQDWTFEASERFEFVAEQTWETRPIDPQKVPGSWTQCVFEVSDAPRYCGTGRWNHKYGVSTWTSDRSWRPLPRREYTKRSDYNAINAENRHTVTPNGWTHEQDNTKTVRNGQQTAATLVREFGFNNYRSIESFDFTPATDYWQRTSAYWALVREAWSDRLHSGSRLLIDTDVDGMPIIEATFEQAETASNSSDAQQREMIDAVLARWTRVD